MRVVLRLGGCGEQRCYERATGRGCDRRFAPGAGAPTCWLACAAILALATPARADRGETALAVEAGAVLPAEGRASVVGQLGVSDVLAVRAELGGAVADAAAGRVAVGAVASLDITEWVPELGLSAAVRIDGDGATPRGALHLGVRRYVGPRWSVGARLVGELGAELAGGLLLSIWHHP